MFLRTIGNRMAFGTKFQIFFCLTNNTLQVVGHLWTNRMKVLVVLLFLVALVSTDQQCVSSDNLKFCTFLNYTISSSVFPSSLDETAELKYKREISTTLAGKDEKCLQDYKYSLCRSLFFKCENNDKLIRPCAKICYNFQKSCGSFPELFDCGEPEDIR
jgi:hypothetical protein